MRLKSPAWVWIVLAACSLHGPASTDTASRATCTDPTPITDANGPTGFVRCADGSTDRVQALTTDPMAGVTQCLGTEDHQECSAQEGCADPGAHCLHVERIGASGAADTGLHGSGCFCTKTCAKDADCGDGYACAPAALNTTGWGVSTCIPASCHANADCAGGECGLALWDDGCGSSGALACRTDAATCRHNTDCAEHACALTWPAVGPFTCASQDCSD